MNSVRFSVEDLALFREASHDANPLHVSPDYARTTAFGEPVVFGILGVLAALSRLEPRPTAELAEVDFEFCNPLHAGIDYIFDARRKTDDEVLVQWFEADRVMAKLRFRFRERSGAVAGDVALAVAFRREAKVRKVDELTAGQVEGGSYAPDAAAFEELVAHWELRERGTNDAQLAALIWSSYFVGMELPGREATFWKLHMTFAERSAARGALDYSVKLLQVDRRFDVLRLDANLGVAGRPMATAQISAFLRAESPRPDLAELTNLLDGCRFAKPTTALVVGGSRGLGAALALSLAACGAQVYVSYRRSRGEAEELATLCDGLQGQVELVCGDASDPVWCDQFAAEIQRRHGGLDLLICNASPAIRALPFATATMPRFSQIHRRQSGLDRHAIGCAGRWHCTTEGLGRADFFAGFDRTTGPVAPLCDGEGGGGRPHPMGGGAA